ncbi:MAG: inorganic pyrophosphatase [Dehalococcoidia bacterium]
MTDPRPEPSPQTTDMLFKAHPWHGVPIGPAAPEVVTAYVEIVPTDTVKYELDKVSGHLKVDRPQEFSNVTPCLYGMVPQTLCAEAVADLCRRATGRENIVGDADPMDICILTEKVITHGDILVQAIPIGGLRLIDRNEADDKIIAVMRGDLVYGGWREIDDCPASVLNRLRHYFLTYKEAPDERERMVEIAEVYGRRAAYDVIVASQADYERRFGRPRPA